LVGIGRQLEANANVSSFLILYPDAGVGNCPCL
jgi:hypothetical protein